MEQKPSNKRRDGYLVIHLYNRVLRGPKKNHFIKEYCTAWENAHNRIISEVSGKHNCTFLMPPTCCKYLPIYPKIYTERIQTTMLTVRILFCHLLTMWLWSICLTLLCLSLFLCKMGLQKTTFLMGLL